MRPLLQRFHHYDAQAFLWFNQGHGCQIYPLTRFVSATGDGPLYAITGLTLLMLDKTQGSQFFVAAMIAYTANISCYLILKNTIKRHRPHQKLEGCQALIDPSDPFSFPSGHTAAAFLFATLLLHFYPNYAVIAAVWAAMIGLSRVLLGVHYPSDILAGLLLGYSCAKLGIMAQNWSLWKGWIL